MIHGDWELKNPDLIKEKFIGQIKHMDFKPATEINGQKLPPVSVTIITDAVVTQNFLVGPYTDGPQQIVFNPGYSHFNLEHRMSSGPYPELFMKPEPPEFMKRYGNGILVCGGPHGGDSYWHWLFDYLPRLTLIRSKHPLVVNYNLSQVQEDMLDWIGFTDNEIIRKHPSEVLRFEGLCCPSFLAATGVVQPMAIEWLRQIYLPMGETVEHSRCPTKIYISRFGNPKRDLPNEKEVEHTLEQEGYVIVWPQNNSIAEQINLFSEAEVIIAPHGAGLANVIWSPPGCEVVEIDTNSGHPGPQNVCEVMEHDYERVGLEEDGSVDIGKLI